MARRTGSAARARRFQGHEVVAGDIVAWHDQRRLQALDRAGDVSQRPSPRACHRARRHALQAMHRVMRRCQHVRRLSAMRHFQAQARDEYQCSTATTKTSAGLPAEQCHSASLGIAGAPPAHASQMQITMNSGARPSELLQNDYRLG
jgi:hypothetical protein